MKKFAFHTALLLIAICCLIVTSPVNAAEKKDEWKDSSFDFKKVVLVALEIENDEKLPKDPIRDVKIKSLIESMGVGDNKQKLSLANYSIIKQDPAEPPIYHVKLIVSVRQYGDIEVWVPEKTRYVTVNRVIEVREDRYENGKLRTTYKRVTVPVTEREYIPAHYETWSTSGLEFRMVDSNGKYVWQLLDLRDSPERRNPYNMMERIINRTVDKLVELKSK